MYMHVHTHMAEFCVMIQTDIWRHFPLKKWTASEQHSVRWWQMRCSVLQRVAACCSVLECVGVCWSALQCVGQSRAGGVVLGHGMSLCS